MERDATNDQLIFIVNLDQLVGGTGAVTILLRLFDVGIVNVFAQPAITAFGSCHAMWLLYR